MLAQRILLVEDESAIREMLALSLQKSGFIVDEAANVHQAKTAVFDKIPDLILLDWMLPDVSGIEFARYLKQDTQLQKIPIIMLTARSEEGDKIKGLEVGADDYITKPFSPRELIARVRAVLRRVMPESNGEQLVVNDLTLDPAEHRITISEKEVQMGPTEFRLLHFFMRHPERVYSRTQVLDQVWGHNVYIEERTVDVHIRRLRKALSTYNYEHLIQTVRGVGYRFSVRE